MDIFIILISITVVLIIIAVILIGISYHSYYSILNNESVGCPIYHCEDGSLAWRKGSDGKIHEQVSQNLKKVSST